MLKGKSISILLVLLVAVFALYTATGAWAETYKQTYPGVCNSSNDPNTCAVTSDGWIITIATGTGAHAGEFPVFCSGTDNSPDCVVDKRGTLAKGYRFAYYIKAPSSGTISQANILASDCPNAIQKTYPTDNSVKILDQDPNTLFGAGPEKVIAWDALKLDQSGKTMIAVYTTLAGAGQQSILLQTNSVNYQVGDILGPICCAETLNITSASYCGRTDGLDCVTIHYSQCTGKFDENKLDPDVLKKVTALWHCDGPFDLRSTTCAPIKRVGPASGSFIDATTAAVISEAPYTGTRYYGYGNKFYKAEIQGIFPKEHICDPNTPSSRVYEQVIIYDNKTKVTYDQCGDVTSVTDSATGTPYPDVTMYIYESEIDPTSNKANIISGGLFVNSGPSKGQVFDGCRNFSIGGRIYCL